MDPGDGTVYTAGRVGVGHETDITAIAYLPDGVRRWQRTLGDPHFNDAYSADIQLDAEGRRLYVAGGSCGPGNDMDFVLLGFQTDSGALDVAYRYPGANEANDSATALAPDRNRNRLLVTGVSFAGFPGDDIVTAAFALP